MFGASSGGAVFLYESTNPLHLYRWLLRESSYLFDDEARRLFPQYIRRAFDRRNEKEREQRRDAAHLKLGRRIHSLLVRANDGDIKANLRVLRYTYGRVGVRRHEMLQPLLVPFEREPPLISNRPRTAPPKILPQLRALFNAQRGRVKALDPDIPNENVWGKPFSLNRAANMHWKVYNSAIASLLPPVSEETYRRLEGLVKGTIKNTLDVKKRSRRARPRSGYLDAFELKRKEVLAQMRSGHYMTDQWQRRVYSQILAESPRLFQEEDTRGAQLRWKAEFSRLARGKMPVEGLPEEFAGITPNERSGMRKNEKVKSRV